MSTALRAAGLWALLLCSLAAAPDLALAQASSAPTIPPPSASPAQSPTAEADVPAPAPAPARIGSAAPVVDAAQFLRLTLALLLVVGLIYLCAWLLRRVQGIGPGGHGVVRVLGSASVGQRERAVLIQVGEQQLLLGVAPGQVRTLHTFAQPLQVPEQAAGRPIQSLRDALRLRGG